MKIEFNEIENQLVIDDNLKWNYGFMKGLMVCNVINGVLYLFQEGPAVVKWFWIVIAPISLALLLFFLFKKATAKKIPLEQVEGLLEKDRLGRKRYSLKLRNGKERDLVNVQKPSDIQQLKEFLAGLGVQMV